MLAVGDAGFRHKCYSRINKLLRTSAVIFVSHSMDQVAQICHAFCSCAGVLAPGTQTLWTGFRRTTRITVQDKATMHLAFAPSIRPSSARISLSTNRLFNTVIPSRFACASGSSIRFEMPFCHSSFRTIRSMPIVCWHTSQFDATFDFPAGASELRFTVGPLHLHPGKYRCSMNMTLPKSIEHCIWYWNQQEFVMEGHRRLLGNIPVLAPYQGHSLRPIPVEISKATLDDHD